MPFETMPSASNDQKCVHGNIGLCGLCIREGKQQLPPIDDDPSGENFFQCEHGNNQESCEICLAKIENDLE